MTEPVLFAVDDGLARITLNRPARLNAFDEATARAWEQVTAEAVARDDVGAILVDAEGPSFCAGGDVLSMADERLLGARASRLSPAVINRGILSLAESAKPVVAAAQGTTAGGGLGILLASDYAVVGDGLARRKPLREHGPHARPVGHGASRPGRRAAPRAAARPAGPPADGRRGRRVGTRRRGRRTRAGARPRARRSRASGSPAPTAAYGQAKRLVRTAPETNVVDQLDDEARTIGAALATPEAQARVAAFAAASARKANR